MRLRGRSKWATTIPRGVTRETRLPAVHIVNVSGGKDSESCYLKAVERGRPFRAVMADTGNEHPWVYEQVERLPALTGGPIVEIIKEDFGPAIARRRTRLPDQWRAAGVPEALIEDALSVLHPTGIPYLDLVMSKGMFATGVSTKFCTEYLKILPTEHQVIRPLISSGQSVIQWLGIRSDESKKRADVTLHPRWEKSRGRANADGRRPALVTFRPLLDWTVEDVIAHHARHNVPMNPLYAEGFERVGCFPCVNERKGGMAIIARRFPDHVARIRAWESLVNRALVARKNPDFKDRPATFFPRGTVPNTDDNPIDVVAKWSLTSRGGKQIDMFAGLKDEGKIACSTAGWCEA